MIRVAFDTCKGQVVGDIACFQEVQKVRFVEPQSCIVNLNTVEELMKRFSGLVIAACLTLLTSTAFGADTIKIGVAGPHTGDLASYGLPTVNAAKLVAKEVNAKGGIDGKQIELLIQDEECKPEKATNVATKLVSDGAAVIVGHICSGATKAALPIYTEAKKVVMSPSATNPDLTQSGQYPNNRFRRCTGPPGCGICHQQAGRQEDRSAA